jgi:hypothetical protein
MTTDLPSQRGDRPPLSCKAGRLSFGVAMAGEGQLLNFLFVLILGGSKVVKGLPPFTEEG